MGEINCLEASANLANQRLCHRDELEFRYMSSTKIKEELANRVARDRKNAVEVSRLADESIRKKGKMERYDPDSG